MLGNGNSTSHNLNNVQDDDRVKGGPWLVVVPSASQLLRVSVSPITQWQSKTGIFNMKVSRFRASFSCLPLVWFPFGRLNGQKWPISDQSSVYFKGPFDQRESRALFMIYHNQTGFVEGRFICEIVRSIFEIIDFIKKEITHYRFGDLFRFSTKLLIIQRGNFSLVAQRLLLSDFIRWVKTMYRNLDSCDICSTITNYLSFQRDMLQEILFLHIYLHLQQKLQQQRHIKTKM